VQTDQEAVLWLQVRSGGGQWPCVVVITVAILEWAKLISCMLNRSAIDIFVFALRSKNVILYNRFYCGVFLVNFGCDWGG